MIKKISIDKDSELKNLFIELKNFLDKDEVYDKLNKISQDFNLDQKSEAILEEIFLDIVKGKIELYEVAYVIETKMSMDLDEAMSIDDRLYDEIFKTVEDDLNKQYALTSINTVKKKSVVEKEDIETNAKQVLNNELIIDDFVNKNNLQFTSDKLQKRFYDIVISYLDNARTKEQFIATLAKDEKVGGMGFDSNLINDIVVYFTNYINAEENKERKQKENFSKKEQLSKEKLKDDGTTIKIKKPKEQSDKLIKAPIIKKDDVSFKKEEQEAEKEKKELKKTITLTEADINKELTKPFFQNKKNKEVVLEKVDNTDNLSKALSVDDNTNKIIDKILIDIGSDFPSTELNYRFKKLIESILREVRTPEQVLERLTLDIKKGGLGIGNVEAEKLEKKINNAIKLETGDLYFNKLNEIKQIDKKTRELEVENKIIKQKNQQQNLDDRYNKLVSKNKKVNKIKPVIKESKLKPNIKVKTGKIPLKEEPAPYFNIPKSDSGRPILEDIKFKTKLFGPVEEIERFGLDDMRKLSNDPKEALLKIRDKISILREESFIKFQSARLAWQKSPLYLEYLDILDQSLNNNLSIDEVLKSRNTLTQTEFNAIMEVGMGD